MSLQRQIYVKRKVKTSTKKCDMWSAEEKKEIIAELDKYNISFNQIAEELKVTRQTISHAFSEKGIKCEYIIEKAIEMIVSQRQKKSGLKKKLKLNQ